VPGVVCRRCHPGVTDPGNTAVNLGIAIYSTLQGEGIRYETLLWRSTQLGVDILRRRSDPRSCDQVTELINLTSSEPDPTIFPPPTGYTRQSPPARH
jgi:hypothetical protein